MPGPTANHPGQRRQQQVVDLGAIGRRSVLQQLPGQVSVQSGVDGDRLAVLRGRLAVEAWQIGLHVTQLILPVRELLLQVGAAGMGLQLFGKRLDRTGLGRQLQRLPGLQLVVGRLQIVEQNPPGDTVHRQVMDHQQQPLRAVGQRRQHTPQQRPRLQIQAALGLIGQSLQRSAIDSFTNPEQWLSGCRHLAMAGAPACRGFVERHAQGIVMQHQCLQGPFNQIGLQRTGWFQQHRLVVVVTLGNRVGEKRLVDRQQQRGALNRGLIDRMLAGACLRNTGQCLHGLVLKQVFGREADPRLTRPADHLDGDDRIATQLEEVVGQADTLQLESPTAHREAETAKAHRG